MDTKYKFDLVHAELAEHSAVILCVNHMSLGSLINHSASSNCQSLRILIDGQPRIILIAKKKIREGDQLTYNYNGTGLNGYYV